MSIIWLISGRGRIQNQAWLTWKLSTFCSTLNHFYYRVCPVPSAGARTGNRHNCIPKPVSWTLILSWNYLISSLERLKRKYFIHVYKCLDRAKEMKSRAKILCEHVGPQFMSYRVITCCWGLNVIAWMPHEVSLNVPEDTHLPPCFSCKTFWVLCSKSGCYDGMCEVWDQVGRCGMNMYAVDHVSLGMALLWGPWDKSECPRASFWV